MEVGDFPVASVGSRAGSNNRKKSVASRGGVGPKGDRLPVPARVQHRILRELNLQKMWLRLLKEKWKSVKF
jgi:hypothetical protein